MQKLNKNQIELVSGGDVLCECIDNETGFTFTVMAEKESFCPDACGSKNGKFISPNAPKKTNQMRNDTNIEGGNEVMFVDFSTFEASVYS